MSPQGNICSCTIDSRDCRGILPMVELIEESRMAVDELIKTLGRATVEAVLWISAASSLTAAEKDFRRIMGYRDLWMLEAVLREGIDNSKKSA